MALIQDIDMTILTKSLKLLHSPNEDSAEQLRILVEETIKNKYGNRKSINLSGLGLNKKSSNTDDMARGKRIKLDESTTPSPLYGGNVEDSQTSNSDSEDGVALEILDYDDLSCVVCRAMAVEAGNTLVECLECHSLYHQECHNPPIVQDVNDPRFVWYCSNCTKSLNKMGTSSSSKGSPSNLSQSSKPGKISSKNSAPSNKTYNVFSSSGKSSSSSSSSSPSSSNSKHSTNSHLSSKTTVIPIPKINITADKRLQIMKKNAAKKHEKRKMTK